MVIVIVERPVAIERIEEIAGAARRGYLTHEQLVETLEGARLPGEDRRAEVHLGGKLWKFPEERERDERERERD